MTRILSYQELIEEKRVRATRATLARWERLRLWPRRVQESPGRIGWREDEVDAELWRRANNRAAA